MIRNFLLVAVRFFMRQRFYSFINVFGLASGLACALFIFLWVRDEVRMDTQHKDVERIFRIVSNIDFGTGEILTWYITPGPLADDIRDNIGEVELAVRTMDNGASLFQYEDKNFLENGIYADSGFFRLFNYPILKGVVDPVNDKSSVAISERLAKNLFGDEDPIGKAVRVAKTYDLQVKAVFKDVDGQSSMKFDFVLPFEIYREQRGDGFNWGNYDHPLFVKLFNADDAGKAIQKINDREDERVRQADASADPDRAAYYIQPLSDVYLYSQFENGKPVGGRIQYIRIFSIVAIFIVLIACINFMNMATAKAAARGKEVGIRKVVGAERKSLVMQFMAESITISAVSMVLAFAVVYLMLPFYNSLVGKSISLGLFDVELLLIAVVIVLLTGLIAGSYPAFFLSSFAPAAVLKGNTSAGLKGTSLRRALVVFQFALTVILIASATIIYRQIDFIRNKNLGYNRESVITFSARGELFNQFETFKTEAASLPGVENMSRANASLVQVNNQNSSVEWPGKPDNTSVFFRTVVVDYDFPETMDLNLVDGRFFSKDFADTNNFILTKRSVEVMGLTDPVGQKISQWGTQGTVVGVVEDFHTRSMQEAIDPIVLMCQPAWTGRVYARLAPTNVSETVEQLREIYKKYSPEYPFEFTFVDDDFEKLYKSEQVTASLAVGFTTLAIIISGLGLLGLAAYTTERKRKEIGIRKTLGASVPTLITMIAADFLKLSVIASVIGVPVSYFLMSKFLEAYAYRTALTWDIFLATAFMAALLSVAIVIFQVTKAALANPVNALRNE